MVLDPLIAIPIYLNVSFFRQSIHIIFHSKQQIPLPFPGEKAGINSNHKHDD